MRRIMQATEKPFRRLSLLLTTGLIAVFVAASCASDSVSDRRSGQVMICHKNKKTLTVSNASSFAHMDHGDTPGPCPNDS